MPVYERNVEMNVCTRENCVSLYCPKDLNHKNSGDLYLLMRSTTLFLVLLYKKFILGLLFLPFLANLLIKYAFF